ncbi:MAG: SRPBCC family protein [Saprospiraceae bacterium]|nr:SRPBCC family protein [Saprospiraceae bacterium]
MKFIFNLIKVAFAIAVIYIIAAFLGKSSYTVERETWIKAPQKLVFNQISVFRNWENWSPWIEKDPTVKNSYEGPDGDPGSVMNWEGDENKSGTGSLKIEAVNAPHSLNYLLTYKVPFEMQSRGSFHLTYESEDKTKVKWNDQGDIPFFFRPIMMFMDMDKQIGPDFERGLYRMDSVCSSLYLEMKKIMEQDSMQLAVPDVQ